MKRFCSLVAAFFLLFTTVQVWAAPSPPVLTHATDGMNLIVNWTDVSDASGYILYYAPYPYAGPETIGNMDMGEETSFSIHLWSGAAYFIAVTASNASGESGYSNINYFVIGPDAADIDDDGDGFTENQGDCNDSDSSIHYEATEICGDNIDQDCSGADLVCAGVDTSLFAETVLSYRTWDDARGDYLSENTDPNYHYISLYDDGTFSDMRYGYCATGQWSYNGQKLSLERKSGCSSLASYSTETSSTLTMSTVYEGNSSDGPFRSLDMVWDNMPQGYWTQWLDPRHLQ